MTGDIHDQVIVTPRSSTWGGRRAGATNPYQAATRKRRRPMTTTASSRAWAGETFRCACGARVRLQEHETLPACWTVTRSKGGYTYHCGDCAASTKENAG